MLSNIISGGLNGLDPFLVQVEVEVRRGPSRFIVIGLGDTAIKEARDRVVSAVVHSKFAVPEQVLINLAPAERKKEGAVYDLAMAVGLLAASGQLASTPLTHAAAFFGELALDGRVRPVRGALAIAAGAKEQGVKTLFVPVENLSEVGLLKGIEVLGVESLRHTVDVLSGQDLPRLPNTEGPPTPSAVHLSLAQVWGQESAKRALLIAAAGGHNLLMIGPPGCGKSMMAERMPSILPPLSESERIECIKIHSASGHAINHILHGVRPFRSPHHTISDAGLIGGGANPRPGEITLAHNGVLFLDEFPEFRRSSLEALRAPLESRAVTVSRARGSLHLPAKIQLIAAMNPCPCGRLGGAPKRGGQTCRCSQASIEKYLSKLSQPILDRIDIHMELDPIPIEVIFDRDARTARRNSGGSSTSYLADVTRIRQQQLERQGCTNSELAGDDLNRVLNLQDSAMALFKSAATALNLSGRGFTRVARVARTIADLSGSAITDESHVAEAIGYRSLERIKRYLGLANGGARWSGGAQN